MDLALHLPLRYEDETTIAPIHDAAFRGGQSVQVEGIVAACEVHNANGAIGGRWCAVAR